MNKYIAVCHDEVEAINREMKRIDSIRDKRIMNEEYENALEITKALEKLKIQRLAMINLIAKMHQLD